MSTFGSPSSPLSALAPVPGAAQVSGYAASFAPSAQAGSFGILPGEGAIGSDGLSRHEGGVSSDLTLATARPDLAPLVNAHQQRELAAQDSGKVLNKGLTLWNIAVHGQTAAQATVTSEQELHNSVVGRFRELGAGAKQVIGSSASPPMAGSMGMPGGMQMF